MGQSEAGDQNQQSAMGAVDIVLALLVVLLVWFIGTKKKKQIVPHGESLPLPPGPRGWPVLGAIPYLTVGCRQEALHKLAQKYGPVMYMHLGSIPTLVVSNAAMAKEIYKTNDRVTASRPDFKIGKMFSYEAHDIAFAPYGNYWRMARRVCTLRLFTTSRISHFQNKRQEEVSAMVKGIMTESQNENPVHMEDIFGSLATNVITQMLWNKRVRHHGSSNSEDFANLSSEFSDLLDRNIGDFIPSLNWLTMQAMGLRKRTEALHNKWDKYFQGILNEHKRQGSHLNERMETPSDAADFVDVLLNLSTQEEEDDNRLSEDSMKAILKDMIIAGTDTMAITLQWALAYLLKNPPMMRNAQDELKATVGADRMVTEEEALNLPYVNAVLKETLRLRPATPLSLPHWSTADFTVNGFHVPANTLVFINLWAIQRDPEAWERPDEFDPERFLHSGAVDWKGQNFELLPFGSGRRICPGMQLASNVLHLALAQMLHTFDWTLPGHQKPDDLDMKMKPGFMGWKDVPLTAVAKPRLSKDVICS